MDPISIGLMAAGTGAQIYGAFAGQSAQEQLMKTQLAQERMIAAKDRLQQVRQLRTQTAVVQQQGANTGVSGSSGIAGGTSTVYGQVGTNIQYIDNQERFGAQITSEKSAINKAQGISELGSDIFNIGAKFAGGGF